MSSNVTVNNSSALFEPASVSLPLLTSDPEGYVQAELVTKLGETIIVKKSITVNTNAVLDIDLPATYQAQTILKVNATTSVPSIVTWSFTPTSGVNWNFPYANQLEIAFAQNGVYTIQASTTNECGTYSKSKQVTISESTCPTCPPISVNSIVVSPNPASSEISVEITTDGADSQPSAGAEPTYTVSITDSNGSPVYKGKKKGKKFHLTVSSLSNGIYNVTVTDGEKTGQGKLIIKH